MDDTIAIRKKMLALWHQYDAKKLSAGEARVHIGFARAVLETMKVDIAVAHLAGANNLPFKLSALQKQLGRQ